jgi:serine/threonine protein kinase
MASYLATELVQGETLRQMISRGPVPLRDLLVIAGQIAGVLVVAHEAGIVHRDIKPENLMVRPDGFVKVLHFGLAKLREGESGEALSQVSLTTPGMVMGTARNYLYYVPHNLRSEGADVLFRVPLIEGPPARLIESNVSGDRFFSRRVGNGIHPPR